MTYYIHRLRRQHLSNKSIRCASNFLQIVNLFWTDQFLVIACIVEMWRTNSMGYEFSPHCGLCEGPVASVQAPDHRRKTISSYKVGLPLCNVFKKLLLSFHNFRFNKNWILRTRSLSKQQHMDIEIVLHEGKTVIAPDFGTTLDSFVVSESDLMWGKRCCSTTFHKFSYNTYTAVVAIITLFIET